jgi:hypothetical protein
MYGPNLVRRIILMAMTLGLSCRLAHAAAEEFVVLPESNTTLTILRGGEPYFDIEFVGWGANWA